MMNTGQEWNRLRGLGRVSSQRGEVGSASQRTGRGICEPCTFAVTLGRLHARCFPRAVVAELSRFTAQQASLRGSRRMAHDGQRHIVGCQWNRYVTAGVQQHSGMAANRRPHWAPATVVLRQHCPGVPLVGDTARQTDMAQHMSRMLVSAGYPLPGRRQIVQTAQESHTSRLYTEAGRMFWVFWGV